MTTEVRNPTDEEFATFVDRIAADEAQIAAAITEGVADAKLTKLERFVIDSEITRLLDYTPYASMAGKLSEADLVLARNLANSLANHGLQRRLAVAWFVEQLVMDNEPEADGPTGATVNEWLRHLLPVALANCRGEMAEAIQEELEPR